MNAMPHSTPFSNATTVTPPPAFAAASPLALPLQPRLGTTPYLRRRLHHRISVGVASEAHARPPLSSLHSHSHSPSPLPPRRRAQRATVQSTPPLPTAQSTPPLPSARSTPPLPTARSTLPLPTNSADTLRHLRDQKLSLLLTDLLARVSVEHPPPHAAPLDALLRDALHLVASLRKPIRSATADSALRQRTALRTLLWSLRRELDPRMPSRALRASLEVVRSACLHTRPPEADDAHRVPPETLALTADISLLEELHALRRHERLLHAAVITAAPAAAHLPQLHAAARAAAALGVDEYRVRGKTRLADAVRALVPVLPLPAADAVRPLADALERRLLSTLQTDLSAKSPDGRAMLLRPRIDDIPNFANVVDTFLRGGQPSTAGLQWLVDYGVSLVIDLRGSDRSNQWDVPNCRLLSVADSAQSSDVAGTPPVRFCNVPIEDFSAPTMDQVCHFIELVDSVRANGGVVFVHCKAGIGRTGTVVACWRISHGMSPDDALRMETLYSTDGGGLRQESFVRQFAASFAQARALRAGSVPN